MAVANPNRLTGGFSVSDVLPGVDFDAFAGGMFPYSVSTGPHTTSSVASYWIGVGATWRFD